MTSEDLRYEIETELDFLEQTVNELAALQNDIGDREPTIRERTAASAFLAQFYNGVENILKRINRYQGVPLPTGDSWHIDLFNRFCEPGHKNLPILFDSALAPIMASFRKFRHVVHHGYGFQIEWDRLRDGISQITSVFDAFRDRLLQYLLSVEQNERRK